MILGQSVLNKHIEFYLPKFSLLHEGKGLFVLLRAANVYICSLGNATDISVNRYSTGRGLANCVISLPYLSFSYQKKTTEV